MNKDIEILVATYNGAAYLEILLDSLLTQTYSARLLIRDDGSSDQTLTILEKWTQKYPDKISLIPQAGKNLGVIGNYSELLKHSKADYILFSDQDDKWLPNKVELSVNLLKIMEEKHGKNCPLLVHTDLKVVDANLNEISPSFWEYVNLNPRYTGLNRLLVQNCVTGCTMAMNRALINKSYPIPQNVLMHDWWIALVASCFGHIQHIEQPTLLYRQHAANTLGAKRYDWIKTIKNFLSKRPRSYRTLEQALCLLEKYDNQLDKDVKATIQSFCSLKNRSFILQRKEIIKHRFFKHCAFHNFVRFFLPFRY